MTERSLVDHAALLRETTLRFLRSRQGPQFYAYTQTEASRPWTIPAKWGSLPLEQQVERAVRAEHRRVAEAITYALEGPLAEAVRTVAHDKQVRLPLTEDMLPSPLGMVVSATPLCDLANGGLTAVTWGPPMEGFGPGVHLTWWSDAGLKDLDAGGSGRRWPLFPDFDLHLPYAPALDVRLWETEVPSGGLYSHVPLRAVVAAWYVLSGDGVELSDRRAEPSIGRELATHKAKHRFVRVAATASAGVAREAIEERAAARVTKLEAEHPSVFGGLGESAATPGHVSHGAFPAELDHELGPEGEWLARLYRAAAEHWHRLESEAQQAYPGVFAHLEELRAREHGMWPSWCWMPSMRVAAWLIDAYDVAEDRAMWDGPRIAALGAWRSGGRHAVLDSGVRPQRAGDPPPVALADRMPAPGLGLVEGGGGNRFVLAFLDYFKGRETPELVCLSDEGDHGRGLRNVTKYTVFLRGKDMAEAVQITQQYYDLAAVENGQTPPSTDAAMCAAHADVLGHFTGPLLAVCAPDIAPVELGGVTGRKPSSAWPPEPGLISEMQLWLLPSQDRL